MWASSSRRTTTTTPGSHAAAPRLPALSPAFATRPLPPIFVHKPGSHPECSPNNRATRPSSRGPQGRQGAPVERNPERTRDGAGRRSAARGCAGPHDLRARGLRWPALGRGWAGWAERVRIPIWARNPTRGMGLVHLLGGLGGSTAVSRAPGAELSTAGSGGARRIGPDRGGRGDGRRGRSRSGLRLDLARGHAQRSGSANGYLIPVGSPSWP